MEAVGVRCEEGGEGEAIGGGCGTDTHNLKSQA